PHTPSPSSSPTVIPAKAGIQPPSISATHNVSTAAALAALISASSNAGSLQPGDTIVLAAGTCQGKFVATVSGGKGLPITLQGSSTTVFTTAGGYGLHLKASYWKLTGFTVQKAQKGIILDGGLPERSDRNCIIKNTLGPNISAEGIDVKEGTRGGQLIGDSCDRPSLSQAGIQVHQKIESGVAYGNNNTFRKNIMSLGGTPGHGFEIQASTCGNTVCSDNKTLSGYTLGMSNLGPVSCATLQVVPTCPAVLNR
nr:hypothetical protein [Leptothrix sp. (in: b-proteobacteria)]